MDNNNLLLLAAFTSLFIGLLMYFWIVTRKDSDYFDTTNLISWLLIALFPVLLIYSFFPDTNNVSGNIAGFSVSGAIGAFGFIWWFGTKTTKDYQREQSTQKQESSASPQVIEETKKIYYTITETNNKKIALVTGDIRNAQGIDIWVNSENTNMQMSRFYENTISGIIRYLGAKHDALGNVIEDSIANELKKVMGNNLSVNPGIVLVTGAGELEQKNGVKKIFHVASVRGEVGKGYESINDLGSCISNSLEKADSQEFENLDIKSILFPLLGTGQGRSQLKEVSQTLLQKAISYLKNNPRSRIETVFFLTYTEAELEECQKILKGQSTKPVPVEKTI